MNKLKKYRRGKRIYTRIDKQTKQVTVLNTKKAVKGREGNRRRGKAFPEADDRNVEARVSDLSGISFNAEEFVLDFYRSGRGRAKLCSRVIISPVHAKRLGGTLSAAIAGEIKKRSGR